MKLIPRRKSNDALTTKPKVDKQSTDRSSVHLESPTLMLLVAFATIGAFIYAKFLFTPGNRGDLLPYIMVIVAESFILLQGLLTLWTILSSRFEPRNFEFHNAQDNLFTSNTKSGVYRTPPKLQHVLVKQPFMMHEERIFIDVFITVYGEPLDIIRTTATAARDMIGAHTTYILDDGKSDDVKQLAEELKVGYIRRENNEGAKAGNINHALSLTSGEYFAIFDADFVPDQKFLYETIPFFENAQVAFVQTPQHYDNDENIIARGAGYMQHVFYALIQPGKNRFNAAFCVGTNVVFRRTAIDELGGMYSISKSEDVWTSLLLHERGFKSVYIPNVLAVGRTPDSIKTYAKQQLRWATGAFEIFFRHNPIFSRALNIDQKVQYLGTATYYFSGLASLLLIMLPPLQIFFNLSPVNLHVPFLTWLFYYSSFYIVQIFVAFYTMGGFRLDTLLLANASFPIYVKAFFNALFKRDQVWQATNRAGAADSPFNYIPTQLYLFVFLALTTVIGVWKIDHIDAFSVSVIWNAINTIVFFSFFVLAMREARAMRKERKLQRNSKKLKGVTA